MWRLMEAESNSEISNIDFGLQLKNTNQVLP